MRVRAALAVLVGLALGGCVSKSDFDAYQTQTQADFDAYKAQIKADGEAVDAWILAAHDVVKWVADNGGTFCPSCDPPTAPPSPPPNGNWGL